MSFETTWQLYKNSLQASAKVYKGLLQYMANHTKQPSNAPSTDPLNLQDAMLQAYQEMWKHPEKAVNLGLELSKSYVDLWANIARRSTGEQIAPLFAPDAKDKRFQNELWDKHPFFDFLRQSYSLNSTWLTHLVEQLQSLPPRESQKLMFYTKFLIDSLAPTNFAALNPDVINEAIATQGESLLKGAERFYEDMSNSQDGFQITTAATNAFEVGRNLAVTPGAVVYQNHLMQLIQYTPSTPKVYEVPLLIIPAWINKYYILDLQEKNSFVRWLTGMGYTVFMISWINPSASLSNKGFFNYMEDGALAAIQQIQKITGCKSINTMGYCLGGTMLACTIAYLKRTHKSGIFPINSVTFLTSLVDFEQAGDLSVFIDEEQIGALEERMSKTGFLDGRAMAQTFSMIRANDMIWSFYINNYLLGKEPFPFDILYWNSDSTRLPAKMHSFYLRSMYHKNLLPKADKIVLNHVHIDIHLNDLPTYMLATRQDHIVPWQSAYKATQIYTGKVRFVLSGSGHVAGVVNHPDNKKYNFWTNDKLPRKSDVWLAQATDNPGSWWTDWDKWNAALSGKMVPARQIDAKRVIEAAPGSYVKERL